MRVAVVSGSYAHGLSYQENIWAEELACMGHEVRVFTARGHGQPPQRHPVPGGPPGCTFEVEEVRSLVLPRQIMPTLGLGAAIAAFAPDRVLWFGIEMFFGRALVTDPRLTEVPVAAFSSLNEGGMHPFDWTRPGLAPREWALAHAFRVLRGPEMVRACLRADLIVANTPETRDILLYYPRGGQRTAIEQKIAQLPLGFSPRFFRFDPETRAAARAALGLAPDDVAVVVSSRFAPNKEKALDVSLRALQQAMEAAPRLHALVVGFGEGGTSERLHALLDRGPHPERFHRFGFADRTGLARHYQAADIAMFARPSISCQESMGTGLYAAFADDGSMTHLLRDPAQGVLFRRDDVPDMARVLAAAARHVAAQGDRAAFRRGLADRARWLGYDRIAEDVLARLEAPRGPR